ncbi:MAG: YnfA family protein [Rhizobacter sp.]|nr:YnfA family protein [Chlorobiales bacterium]
MNSIGIFIAAAFFELAGCFAFWAWLRLGKSFLFSFAGVLSLTMFAYLLTKAPTAFAGRAYAAYGGIYVAASVAWLMLIERAYPDLWDVIGVLFCLAGACIILFAPR